jgi:hypothetical protein
MREDRFHLPVTLEHDVNQSIGSWNARLCSTLALILLIDGNIRVSHCFSSRNDLNRYPVRYQPLCPSFGLDQSSFYVRRLSRFCSENSFSSITSGYVPPEESQSASDFPPSKVRLYARVGDIVRCYDLLGGKQNGEVIVGRISFIQKNIGGEGSGWTVDVAVLDDVGDGYYAEFSSIRAKTITRDLIDVAPISASFVGRENAWKVPRLPGTVNPIVRSILYDIEGYEGPQTGLPPIDENILEQDLLVYQQLKANLLRYTAITGAIGTCLADIISGPEDAIVYAGGVLCSVVYLLFLSWKTDTIGSQSSKMGNRFSNFRFLTPFFAALAVALYNKCLGNSADPSLYQGPFDLITKEQFAALMLGFFSYRIPLFLSQLVAFSYSNTSQSIGIEEISLQSATSTSVQPWKNAQTVLLVSGPKLAGRSELFRQLVQRGSQWRFVEPDLVDRFNDPANFERLDQRNEIIEIDPTGRYGLTLQNIRQVCDAVALKQHSEPAVVALNVNVATVPKVLKLPHLRFVGVWIGLSTVKAFEDRLHQDLDSGELAIPANESRESFIRLCIKEIIQEIEFGIGSGVFEFTVLNEGSLDESFQQLLQSAEYCFK